MEDQEKYERAKKRVQNFKDFYDKIARVLAISMTR
jgi:hypothetical protein